MLTLQERTIGTSRVADTRYRSAVPYRRLNVTPRFRYGRHKITTSIRLVSYVESCIFVILHTFRRRYNNTPPVAVLLRSILYILALTIGEHTVTKYGCSCDSSYVYRSVFLVLLVTLPRCRARHQHELQGLQSALAESKSRASRAEENGRQAEINLAKVGFAMPH